MFYFFAEIVKNFSLGVDYDNLIGILHFCANVWNKKNASLLISLIAKINLIVSKLTKYASWAGWFKHKNNLLTYENVSHLNQIFIAEKSDKKD